MGDLLEKSSDFLRQKRQDFMTRSVDYTRAAESVTLLATIGRTIFEVDAGNGILEKFEVRDYLIRTEDLILSTLNVLPERGDVIKETVGSTTYHYEVNAPDSRQDAFRFSDAYRKTLRIHTKLIDTVTV